jgi:carbamoylphosphate synthase large subunit
MKRLLILGGTHFQIPVIEYAKLQGHYVITCDYLPENPGHALADEYYNISTTDVEGVLKLSKKLKIDGILAFASDPAAPTAAYVSERMGLPGNEFRVVETMSEKDKFRAFLLGNDFNVPYFKHYTELDSLLSDFETFDRPMILKPVDSSGSKGVAKLGSYETIGAVFSEGMKFSRCKRVIVEEYIDGPQFHGDAFVSENRVVFSYLGDHFFDGIMNNSTMYPSQFPDKVITEMENEVHRFITLIGFQQGGINVEIRRSNSNGSFYIIEIGPRNGGHLTPNIIQYASGFNFFKAAVDAALGFDFDLQPTCKQGHYANLVLYSTNCGPLKGIDIHDDMQKHLLDICIYRRIGEEILPKGGSNTAVGTLLLKFSTAEEMHHYIGNSNRYYRISVH